VGEPVSRLMGEWADRMGGQPRNVNAESESTQSVDLGMDSLPFASYLLRSFGLDTALKVGHPRCGKYFQTQRLWRNGHVFSNSPIF
jgi:hypothetical protein